MILKAVKYRLDPTDEQCVLIDKHIGSCRFVYNLALETKQFAYAAKQVNLSCFDLIKQLPELKKECEWLKEINSQSLQQAITHLDSAFTSFFKGQAAFPKFKSKRKSKQSFKIPQNIIVENNLLIIPKFKEGISVVVHRPFEGTFKQATITKTPTGKYFVSILVETPDTKAPKAAIVPDQTLGIDLGIKDFAVTSNGERIENPRTLKRVLGKLKFTQRKYSKHKGKRTKKKLALLHEKVSNQRRDFLHKITKKLVVENQTIALEDLNVKGMIQNHCLAQAIQDVSWGTFGVLLQYKAEWYGTNLLTIGRFEPSSKMSDCGYIHKELTLAERTWTCPRCANEYDRDLQAAKNIKKFALRNYVSGTDTQIRIELPTLVGVLTCEAATPLG
jgi:putative transposase